MAEMLSGGVGWGGRGKPGSVQRAVAAAAASPDQAGLA